MVSSNIGYSTLTSIAGDFVSRMFDKVKTLRLPGAIKTATTVGRVEEVSVGYHKIDITINLDIAPMALAYEFGSGIHATRAKKKTYRIGPKTKKLLAFYWKGHTKEFWRGRKYRGYLADGRLLFSYVDHPGVAPRPYIVPAVQETLENLDEVVRKKLTAELLIGKDEVIEVKVGK